MSPKITVLIYTARGDHPYADRSWHCFDPVVKTLAAQTFTDFELVLVDMQWETRRDYFEKRSQPFPVKHVPSSPNRWQSQRRTGLCEQINRGFAWADGELIWMGGENNMFPPTHLARAWELYQQTGALPVAWYAICGAEKRGRHRDCPVEFDLLGYTHEHVAEMDHRGKRFVENRGASTLPCHYQNYFGYSSVSAAAVDKTNGFDELFDGQWGLFDVDFGSRLDLAGYKMVLARDLFIVEPVVAATGLDDAGVPKPAYAGIGHQDAFKCHYAIYLHNRATHRRVNRQLPGNYVADVKAKACFGECSLKVKCAAGAKHAASTSPPGGTPADGSASQYIIGESKYYPFCEGKNRDVALELFADPTVREISNDRLQRRAGTAPYDRCTFVRGTTQPDVAPERTSIAPICPAPGAGRRGPTA